MAVPDEKILEFFEQINAIPRCSKNEAALCGWLINWAKAHHFAYQCDSAGNLVVRVPASKGCEKCPVVVIQGHMDMVCEKTPDCDHDFSLDPIVSHREGQWLMAEKTTLGADNGIAIAYAMALAEQVEVRPPLELLFTTDEETGLNGAKLLTPDFIQGRILINLDSEDEGVFTVGCAGGIDTAVTLSCQTGTARQGVQVFPLVVGGLRGGHSGIDIHKNRGNANKILARLLERSSEIVPLELISLDGGTRKNAIPRDARATFCVEPSLVDNVQTAIARLGADMAQEYQFSDPDLTIKLGPAEKAEPSMGVLNSQATRKVIQLLLALPNGVYGTSGQFEGLVETSCNLATMTLASGKLSITSSQRSCVLSRLFEMTSAVHAVAALAGAAVEDRDIYHPWPVDRESTLLNQSKRTYSDLYGCDPKIQVIHAGLECAVIGGIYPGTDMISFGPTIRDPHSPRERLHLPSVGKVWDFLAALMKALTEQPTDIQGN